MSLSYEEQNDNIAFTEEKRSKSQNSKSEHLQAESKVDLLQAVVESFVDGILILTTEGELLHTNECARQFCRQLLPEGSSPSAIPEEVWRVYQSLIDSRELFPKEKFFIESELETDRGVKLRIRARWLPLATSEQNFVLVILEDRSQMSQSMALCDAKKYGLTNREAEVWLLRRANLSYKEIAQQLYITINTVKKHLKNIYAKQQEILC
ncbi:MAG: helix-turn-helix transcriptional regulator [Iphinoe sp. HA4291-MV1]|jgi:RNA polymerase sigma factor (sigma-70 family)|nr:helix-turn-helix transcriptional regulator [Iphinoe sp. HA4291-MV1]